ncbi:MAG: hypothetical protein QHH26_11355 [Armatimonadota bacterium]|nr:hypothetical protein [Armatimonadota bacterium]
MRYSLLLLLIAMSLGMAFAAEEPQQTPAQSTISIDFADMDISQALSSLAQKAQITIVVDPNIKGKVTCSLNDVQPEQALATICKLNKLTWVKTYTSAGSDTSKLDATKLINLLDALKALGNNSLILEDSASQSATIFAAGVKLEAEKVNSMAADLKLKPVYLVRGESSASAEAAKKAQEGPKQVQSISVMMPPSDPRAAAQEVWSYFAQMTPEQRGQVMHEIRHMMFENLTPEQREEMRRRFEDWRRRRDDGPRDGRQPIPGPMPPPPPPPQPRQ